MILLIDNYDSFVFNLARYVRELGREVRVVRNDAIDPVMVRDLVPDAIILSPGPCAPDQAGQCLNIVRENGAEFPILGVCLGHQVIAQVFGGVVVRAKCPLHGKATPVTHQGCGLFQALPNPLTVTRYHSLIAQLPEGDSPLEITAYSTEGEIMALAHKNLPLCGVQFHPEAVLTTHGHDLLQNFLNMADQFNASKPGRSDTASRAVKGVI